MRSFDIQLKLPQVLGESTQAGLVFKLLAQSKLQSLALRLVPMQKNASGKECLPL